MSTGDNAVDPADALIGFTTLVQRAFDRCAAAHGIAPVQARMLHRLRSDGAPTINELAQRLALDKSSTSGLVDRAQRRGLVRRVPSQLDRRSVRVRLTPAGRELTEQLNVRFGDELGAMLAPLSASEQTELTGALARLARN